MKTAILLCLIFGIYSCGENKKPVHEIVAKPSVTANDTFMRDLASQITLDDRELFMSDGIRIDTIKKKFKNGKVTETRAIPVLIEKILSEVDAVLRKNITAAGNRFRDGWISKGDPEDEKRLKGGKILMEPVMIYKNEKIINYCFEQSYNDNTIMRPYRDYYSLTYDLAKNKIINGSNFFNISSAKDSAVLTKYILRGLDPPIVSGINFAEIDFSMDDSVIYFFTGQYDLGIPFNHSCGIKRKYIDKFIRNEYK
jgi:hypothetical protein